MLDKIAMITFLGLYIICIIITLFMYLVIVGANKSKTNEERCYEDEEQMKIVSKDNKSGGISNE